MKDKVIKLLGFLDLNDKEIEDLIEIPKNSEMGDFAFPCFRLSKKLRKNPNEIAKEIVSKIKGAKDFEKIEAVGPYVNFFVDKRKMTHDVLTEIIKKKEKYGSESFGKGKKIIVEMSSPNIAKPFGVGHLRSTIIGNSLSKIYEFYGYKTIKINYLGDWGTQFGKMIVGYKKFGKETELKKNPIKHLLEIYVKANKEEYEAEAREWFKKLEEGNKEALVLWKKFKDLSLKEFDEIYKVLGIRFDEMSGESFYSNKSMSQVVELIRKKKLTEISEGAEIINLEGKNLGVCLIKKSDGTTLYITRDIAAAIDRYKRYKFDKMIYEVGSEQKLHFKQLFEIINLLEYDWAKKCVHVDHGLYLDKDGKKFSTRRGKVVFMKDVLEETILLAEKEIKSRFPKLSGKALEERARKIAIASIFYGDLKNYRGSDMVFDLDRFVSFEGDTGPYMLYGYARAKSILKKAKYKPKIESCEEVDEQEKKVMSELARFPEVVKSAYDNNSPNIIATYAFQLTQVFNEFYHSSQVIHSEKESFRLALVYAFTIVLRNALNPLGVEAIDEM